MIRDFPGNYSQFRLWQTQQELPEADYQLPEKEITVNSTQAASISKRRISYKDKREFEMLAKEIEALTSEKDTITRKFSEGGLSFEELQDLSQRIGEVSSLLDAKEMRWLELSEIVDDSG